MLQLTKRTEYGLIALSHLVDRRGEFVSVREICERFPVPRRLVAEVLKDLCRKGLVESQRGATGGYALSRPAESITVGTVVGALEGEPRLASCHVGDHPAGDPCDVAGVCPIRDPILRLRIEFWSLLERMSLRDLVREPARLPVGAAPL
ncbi:MAG: Rrf2 family transcriptional regulator [Planctomycetota bacterium]